MIYSSLLFFAKCEDTCFARVGKRARSDLGLDNNVGRMSYELKCTITNILKHNYFPHLEHPKAHLFQKNNAILSQIEPYMPRLSKLTTPEKVHFRQFSVPHVFKRSLRAAGFRQGTASFSAYVKASVRHGAN